MKARFQGGAEIKNPPKMFIGAAANPFADPFELRVARLAKKVKAGVDFVQTQCIYNIDKFETWMKGVRERGLHEKVYIMAGITPMKSAGMARYMKNKVPGMDVPDELVKRMAAVPKDQQPRRGLISALNPLNACAKLKGFPDFISWPSSGKRKCPRS
jgi:methylenetetrahydrofolate reductase (NADPH)